MRPFNGKGSQQAFWLKLPFFCLIGVTLAFAMVVLVAPLVSIREAKISSDDPSRQWIRDPFKREAEVLSTSPKIEEAVEPEEVPAKVDEQKQAKTGNSSASELLLQLPSRQEMECDLFQGQWVEETSRKPLYANATCPIMSQQQNCPGNGRPDSGFLNWKWKPQGCALPDFDAVEFLNLMRGKTVTFVGDSVTRNQYEALLCTLWQVTTPVARGNKKLLRWYFKSYNFRLVRIWSSWLVNVTTDAVPFAPEGLNKLHLDVLDATIADSLPSFDVLVVASGHWWGNKPGAYVVNGTSVVGGQQWWNTTLNRQYDTLSAYRVAMEMAVKAIVTYPGYKGLTIFRTYSPDHYEGGAWNTGGSCTGKMKPLTDDEIPQNSYMDAVYGHQMAALKAANVSEERLRVMDIMKPFRYRADGHPGPYRNNDPNKQVTRGKDGKPPPQDCLHWCMPGPVDTWNEYLLAMLQRHYSKQ